MKYALVFCLLAFSAASSARDFSKFCVFNRCKEGDVVVTAYNKASPAVGCPTKNLSIYANFIITNATFGVTEDNATGETSQLVKKMRDDAGVSNFKEAAQGCWPIKPKQRVIILEYSERGAVKVSPIRGGTPYWTQSNHLDKP